MANYFLAIESATKMCSVALYDSASLLDKIEEGGDYSHAEKLAPFVNEILKNNGLTTADLSAIGVSSGPGSYTGLRIGLSLAKGICFASELPLISIDTLKGMAKGAIDEQKDPNAFYIPMIDARRMEVYSAVYDGQLNALQEAEATVVEENSFAGLLEKQQVYFFGDGAAKCQDVIDHPNASFLDQDYISAGFWGDLIEQKFLKQEFEDLAYYEPFYLKEFKAGKPKSLL